MPLLSQRFDPNNGGRFVLSADSTYAISPTVVENAALKEALDSLSTAAGTFAERNAQWSKDLQPGALLIRIREAIKSAVLPAFQTAQRELVKAKDLNAKYDDARNLNGPGERSHADALLDAEIRSYFRTLSSVQQVEYLLAAKSAEELDPFMVQGVRHLLQIEEQVWDRVVQKYRNLAHTRYVRQNLGDLRKAPTLDEIAPLSNKADEERLAQITTDAIQQRARRIDETEAAENYLRQFIAVTAVALELKIEDAFDVLFGNV